MCIYVGTIPLKVCAYTFACMHMHACAGSCIYTHTQTHGDVFIVSIFICIHNAYTYMPICAYIYKHKHAWKMCSYVHISMHAHTHVASWYIHISMPRLTCMHKHAFFEGYTECLCIHYYILVTHTECWPFLSIAHNVPPLHV